MLEKIGLKVDFVKFKKSKFIGILDLNYVIDNKMYLKCSKSVVIFDIHELRRIWATVKS